MQRFEEWDLPPRCLIMLSNNIFVSLDIMYQGLLSVLFYLNAKFINFVLSKCKNGNFVSFICKQFNANIL